MAVFADAPLPEPQVALVKTNVEFTPSDGGYAGTPSVDGTWTLPAARLTPPAGSARAQLVLSPAAAATVGAAPQTVGLTVSGVPLSRDSEDRLQEAVAGVDPEASFYVERGYDERPDLAALALLGAAGGVLVLGGTLTATLLALADARPDFATLGAVGAAPRTRRSMAACYAGVLGLLGALLGAAVGLVPGIAVAFPLTRQDWRRGSTDPAQALPDVFIDVPWLLIGAVVLGVPLLAAVGVGLLTRSQLPLTARQAA